MNLRKNIESFQNELKGTGVTLVAVSKTKPAELLKEAYEHGIRVFGENKVQELTEKHPALPRDIEWHMIGHLQRNKVKYIAPFISLIHSIDSLRLLKEVNKQALKSDRTIDCLLQVHIAQEEHKFGFTKDDVMELMSNPELSALNNIRITGLMGMATFTENKDQVRAEFRGLKQLFDTVNNMPKPANASMQELSMGMSGDYQIAIEEGSTMIRVGSMIFGARNQH